MPHCTPEDIALAALGEDLPGPDAAHLAGCADLPRREVASLQRAVHLLGAEDAAGPPAPVPLPPRVWEAIAAETGVRSRPGSAAQPAAVLPSAPLRRPTVPPRARPRRPRPDPCQRPRSPPVADLAAARDRRRPRWVTAVAVAASLLVGRRPGRRRRRAARAGRDRRRRRGPGPPARVVRHRRRRAAGPGRRARAAGRPAHAAGRRPASTRCGCWAPTPAPWPWGAGERQRPVPGAGRGGPGLPYGTETSSLLVPATATPRTRPSLARAALT